jgi:CubicO group peptidase (beta-lactamase class C family)
MKMNLKLKSLIAVTMLSSFSNITSASTAKNIKAPEVSTAQATLSYSEIPYLDKAFIDATPADRKDGILVGELGIDGGNKNMIVKLAKEIAEHKHGSYDSLLIAHKGKLLFESYYSRGRINLPHYQASATKAYTGLALGRAIQLGYLSMADLDKPLVSFLKDLDPTRFVEGAEKITLFHALTMRSGIRISDEQRKEFKKKPNQLKGQGEVQVLLEHSAPITEESQSFKYGGGPVLVMQVIDAVVPGSAKDFIKNELLDKMGIANYNWRTNGVSGMPEAGWRTSMTSRDMLKWGTLAMNKGKWKGEQLIPEAYIAKATSRHLLTGDDDVYGGGKDVSKQGYGFFWWSADLKVGNKSYFAANAQGGNGQFIILIEELDLLIVVTDDDNDNTTLQLTAERILPAFTQNSIPTMSAKSDSQDDFPALKDRYFSQKPPGLIPELFAPGIVATEEYRETVVTFSPDMTELAFSRSGGEYKEWTLFVMQNENERWSNKSIPSTDTDKYAEKFNPSLSEIKSIETFKDIPIEGFSISSKDTYYFYVLDFEDGSGHMSYSRLINGKYEKPHKMNKGINRGKYIAHPFIAPDESYLMWDAEKIDEGTPDIYISFKQQDGSWGDAINLGDKINTAAYEQRPRVTPDGKYLFFWRGDKRTREDGSTYWTGNPHWVDAQIIESLRPI